MQEEETSISKVMYRGTTKLDMRKSFAFFLSRDLDLVVSETGNEMEDGGM